MGPGSKSVPPKDATTKSVPPSRGARSKSTRPPAKRSSIPPPPSTVPGESLTLPRLPRLHGDEVDEDGNFARTSQTKIRAAMEVAAAQHAVLTVLTGVSAGRVTTLHDRETVIGRSHGCQIVLSDQGISRQHCRILGSGERGYVVEDMESTNGTYLNGKRVTRIPLRPGDRIQVGADVVVRFSISDETEEQLAKRLYESSTRDPLTTTFTRKYFMERFEAEFAYALRHKSPLGVLIIDLDHFKKVNDTAGHQAGDALLRGVAIALHAAVRTEDVLARFGGEEFVIGVRGVSQKQMANMGERIRKGLERVEVPFGPTLLKVTASIGVAMLHECKGAQTIERVLALADQRLYQAKKAGRNCVVAG